MRDTEFWQRMEAALGVGYARSWAQLQVLAELNGHTVEEALEAGIQTKTVWRAVWAHLRLPAHDR